MKRQIEHKRSNKAPYQQVLQDQLNKISQMTTFYLKDWKVDKNWRQSQQLQRQRQQNDKKQKSKKNKTSFKGLFPKKRTCSLPSLNNISMPPKQMTPLSDYRKQIYNDEQETVIKKNQRNFHKIEKDLIDTKILKRNLQVQKRIIKQIDEQVKKLQKNQQRNNFKSQNNIFQIKPSSNRQEIIYIQKQFDLISSKTNDIKKSYDRLNKQKYNTNLQIKNKTNIINNNIFKKKQKKDILTNYQINQQKQKHVKTSIYSIQKKINQIKNKDIFIQSIRNQINPINLSNINKNDHNEDLPLNIINQNQNLSLPLHIQKNKIQLKSKEYKINLKRQIVSKILRKYDSNLYKILVPQNIFDLKQVQKYRRRELIKGIILKNKQKYQSNKIHLHSSAIKKANQIKKDGSSYKKHDIFENND